MRFAKKTKLGQMVTDMGFVFGPAGYDVITSQGAGPRVPDAWVVRLVVNASVQVAFAL